MHPKTHQLQLPSADTYGNHPAVEQDVLTDYLTACGLQRTRTFELELPPCLERLRNDAAQEAGPVLISLSARELPEVIPDTLSNAVVWYFWLPADMHERIPDLLHAKLTCYGGLTGEPWSNAVFLSLSQSGREAERSVEDTREFSFLPAGLNLDDAYSQGFAIALFDCGGTLYARGIPVGEELLIDLQACEGSSFQKPLRACSLRELQERTRAVEDTGLDPAGPPSQGNIVLPVQCSSNFVQASPAVRDETMLFRRVPVSWHSMNSAVIGWLANITHFPEECQGGSPLALKVQVVPEIYERICAGRYTAKVMDVALRDAAAQSAYVLQVHSENAVCIITMNASDVRFKSVYDYWSRTGSFLVAFENFHNGRLRQVSLLWPRESRARQCSAERLPTRHDDHLYMDAAIQEAVKCAATRAGRRLTCYMCDVIDEEAWKREEE